MQKKEENFKKKIIVWVLLLGVTLVGCQREILYDHLSQEDANKVMVLLQKHGIEASLGSVEKQNEISWNLQVSKNDLPRARELIVSSNIISPKSPGLKEVYQAGGSSSWIKTPAEERARYLLALKGEVVNALKRLPDVVEADVVLNIPEPTKLGREQKRPTASVVIKAQKPQLGESALSEVVIQQWVSNTVEDLAPRDVSVLINYVAPIGTTLRPGETVTLPHTSDGSEATTPEGPTVRLMGLQLNPASRQRLKVYLLVFFTILVLLSLALIVTILQSRRTRQELKALKGGETPLVLEEGRARPRLPSGKQEEEEREE